MKNTIKKIILAMALVPLMVSTSFAAASLYQVPVVNGDGVTTADCKLLGSDVSVGLSKDVMGAISCDQTKGKIQVGTCSVAGTTKVQTLNCSIVTPAVLGAGGVVVTPAVYNDSVCDAATPTFQSVGRNYFTMSTAGGGLSTGALSTNGDAVCDGDAVLSKIKPL